jgi:hydroxyacylglutathione hydrolase
MLEANCHLVAADAGPEACAIDPGGDADVILGAAQSAGLTITHILDTHGHPDHTAANCALKAATGARVYIHESDRAMIEGDGREWVFTGLEHNPCQADETFADGDDLHIGELTLRVFHTPGHTPGSCCLAAEGALFTGDTLFEGSIGRTDFPGGDTRAMDASLRRIVELFADETVLYPGHGGPTDLGTEKATNPWLVGLGEV